MGSMEKSPGDAGGSVLAPPELFNVAEHLLTLNVGRPGKAAFVDGAGVLAYGELEDRVRRFASALCELGIKREERVLLAMQDVNDWPVAFLGAIYAGIVPVAVNTLLTADDYAYMLEHSRAQVVLVSGAVLPAIKAALTKSDHEVSHVVVSRPSGPLSPGDHAFDSLVDGHVPMARPARTRADDPAFWLYSSGSTGRPKGAVHTHANPYWTAELYAKRILGLAENDICFSAAKLFFAYGLGNGLTFPMSVGATTLLMPERPTPEEVFKRWTGGSGGVKPTVFFGAPTGFAGMLASPNLPAREDVSLRLVSSAGDALPAELGQRFKDHFGVDIVDNRLLEDIRDTEPYKWNGGNPDIPTECGVRTEKYFWRSENYDARTLADLTVYIMGTRKRPNRALPGPGKLTPAQDRGKVIFERTVDNFGNPIPELNRCNYCHSGPKGTNQKSFDVGTKKWTDRSGLLDTPQLTSIALTAPYLHDGSARTLEEIWTVYNPHDQHGRTNDLIKDQLNDLIEYLRTR